MVCKHSPGAQKPLKKTTQASFKREENEMTSSPYIKFSFPYLVFFPIFSFILTHSFLSSVLRCHCDVKIRRALFCNVHCPWILKSLHPYILLLPLFSYLHRNSKHLKIRTTAAVLCSAFVVLGFFFSSA